MKKILKILLLSVVITAITGAAAFATGVITWGGTEDVVVIKTNLAVIDNMLTEKDQTINNLKDRLENGSNHNKELDQAEKDVSDIRKELEKIINKHK